MQDSDKILSRLIDILKKLSKEEKPKVKALALEFGVTERTIQRDIYQRLLNFPIEKNEESELQFVNGFTIDQSVLDSDEILFTYLTLCKVKEENPHFSDTINKILKKLLKPHKNSCTIHPEIKSSTIKPELLSKIGQAISKNNILKVELHSHTMNIKPFKIIDNNWGWVLLAQDCEDGNVKSIKLDNITEVHKQKKRFKTKKSFDETLSNVHSSFFKNFETQECEAIVDKEAAIYFYNEKLLYNQKIIESFEDGSIKVQFSVENERELENLVKHWIPHIRITKPEYYNKTIIAKMQNYIQQCNTLN